MKWFPDSVLTKPLENSHSHSKIFLSLEAENFTHKIFKPNYWHVIVKLATFKGPESLSTTIKLSAFWFQLKASFIETKTTVQETYPTIC